MPKPHTVGREKLLRQLELVQPGLSEKDLIDQATCFVFQDGMVITYNEEVCCKAESLLNGVEGAVPAKKLLELVRMMTEDDIQLSEKDGRLLVQGNRKGSGIRLQKEVLLAYDAVEKPTRGSWKELHEEFLQAVDVVQHCATSDQSMPVFTCVHIHPDWLEACDDHHVARYNLKTGVSRPALIKRDHLKKVAALGVLEYAETPGWFHFRSDEVKIACRRYLDDYKDVSPAFKVKGENITLPKALIKAAERAALCCEEDMVTVKLRHKTLRVESEDASAWYYEDRDSDYQGPRLEFLLPPSLLAEIVDKYDNCIVSDTKLKVVGEKWQYVVRLNTPEESRPKEEEDGASDAPADVGGAAEQSGGLGRGVRQARARD